MCNGTLRVLFQHQAGPLLALMFGHDAMNNLNGAIVGTTIEHQNHVEGRGKRLIEQTHQAPFNEQGFIQNRNDRGHCRHRIPIHGRG